MASSDIGWRRLVIAVLHPGTPLRIGASLLCLGLVIAMFWLGSQPGASKFIPTPPWDRLLHFVVYGGYATLAWIGFGGRRWLAAALVAIVIGFLDEGLQSLAPGRTADWTDIAADVAGALVAVAVLGALRRRFSRS
ncbi:MAG: VanZ family protein [Burkholderiaceae bacterium]